MTKQVSRGIRNNNPLNIVKNPKNNWQGLAPDQIDERFCTFINPTWGIRAAAILLIKYYDQGFNTVPKIIQRWAPDFENDTTAYVDSICKQTGFTRNRIIDLHEYEYLAPMIRAMGIHENGSFPYSEAQMKAGLLKAGVVAPEKPILKTGTGRAATVAAVATGADAISKMNDTLNNAAPAIGLIDTLSQYAGPALCVIAIAGIGFMVWDYVQKRKQKA